MEVRVSEDKAVEDAGVFPPITPPDDEVRERAIARHAQLTKPAGSLGRLEELGAWIAACQGTCPPKPFERARVVVFAGDHGIAAEGVSAYPSEVTAQMVANFLAGGAAVNVLAAAAGATVRVADIAVAGETAPMVSKYKVRTSSGLIDREDALSAEETAAALRAGREIADEEIDGGADILVAGDMGIGNTTPSAVLIAALTGTEPVAVVGRGTGIDDQGWIRKTAAIRDALRRARKVGADPVGLLRTAGGADIAAMAGFLAQAAARRTPVVLDGVVVGAAAMVAEEMAPGSREWWVAGHRSVEPAHTVVLDHLDLKPILDFGMRLGEGSGALTALPVLSAATKILAEMATFADAGVSGGPTTPSDALTPPPAPEPQAAPEPPPAPTYTVAPPLDL
ncbi:nicotinate-nucleotide-dimethylbenzimidazole phosphoribosyltransferase [Allokutzneria albata]|uniref:Nicotinate-nucleotide--dimethylbenzimidazole phosphoribosyltransferase n=1 Tax=Allokutzneria albata TaxID=211114 RepID=A0A1H0CNT6_ALLAB|nr:nicotinate-nucleotide-dimethylbenzimidazole phosphoribosyltransferase [Allokutzneria albata]